MLLIDKKEPFCAVIEIILPKTKSKDIIPLWAGEHKTPPSHSYGPYIRDCVLIHVCLSGKGVLYNERGAHRVSAGELFVIREGETTTYTADKDDPWHYVWIAFIGERARDFDSAPDACAAPRGFAERLAELVRSGVRSPDIYTAMVYELMHLILPEDEQPSDRLSEVRRYVKYNYMKDISAGDIAKDFGFDRSHLYRIFKERYGTGIKAYITEVRMAHARGLLLHGHRVSDTAYMVGFHDEFNFSKAYKKHFGYAPITDKGLK
jgi:AraC-like DNA-binding protein